MLLAVAACLLASGPWCAASLSATAILPPRHDRSLLAHVKRLHNVAVPSLRQEISRLEEELRTQVAVEGRRLDGSLRAMRVESNLARQRNERISWAIAGLQANASSLRAEGEELLRDCELLSTDIEAIQKNSSVAGDFLDEIMNQSDFALWHAPEVQVLAELDAKDADARHDATVQRELSKLNIKHIRPLEGATRSALLQLPDVGVQDTLSSLLMSVEDFRRKQNTTFMQMHAAYDQEMSSLQAEYASTMREQARLNATRVVARQQKAQLEKAIGHLRKARDVLFDRSKAVRRFALKMGATLPVWLPLAEEKPARAEVNRHGTSHGWGILGKLFGARSAHVVSLFGGDDVRASSPGKM